MDSQMDQCKFFSGSSHLKYQPTEYREAAIGLSKLQSILAMKQYSDVSVEEIRLEDYNASGGFFGSAFAKLAGAMCVRPSLKMRPYFYGELYAAALKTIETGGINKQEDSKIGSLPAVPQNQIQKPTNINLSFHAGKQNVTIFIHSDADVNFSFKGNSAVAQPSLEMRQQLKVRDRPITEPIYSPIQNQREDPREAKDSTENYLKRSSRATKRNNSKRFKH